MMRVKIAKVRAHITIHFDLSGSVLAETVRAGCLKVETSYDIESNEDKALIASVLRNARNGCWVRAAVSNPVPFSDSIVLNGQQFDIDEFPRGSTT